jgi:hypothetical protein
MYLNLSSGAFVHLSNYSLIICWHYGTDLVFSEDWEEKILDYFVKI